MSDITEEQMRLFKEWLELPETQAILKQELEKRDSLVLSIPKDSTYYQPTVIRPFPS
jgi:hypothetical protein